MRRIMIAAAGTGGHIFPGLVAAQQFLAQGDQVVWVGTEQGMENKIVPEQNITLLKLSITGVRGKGIKRLIQAPWSMFSAILAARRLIKQTAPDLVLGMGGYIAAPVGIAAKLSGIPLVIHEQNAVPGMTNQLLAKIADRVCESFSGTFAASKKIVLTGNLIRPEIIAVKKTSNRALSANFPLNILVLGGSLGAKAINDVIPVMLADFQQNKLQVWHQTGLKDFDEVKVAYQTKNLSPYKLMPFIDNMAEAYAWADLVICRAGATTVAELSFLNLPAILVPFPHAVDDHQTVNAKKLVEKGGAVLLPQNALSSERLRDEVNQFILNFAQASKTPSTPLVAERELSKRSNLIEVCRSLIP